MFDEMSQTKGKSSAFIHPVAVAYPSIDAGAPSSI